MNAYHLSRILMSIAVLTVSWILIVFEAGGWRNTAFEADLDLTSHLDGEDTVVVKMPLSIYVKHFAAGDNPPNDRISATSLSAAITTPDLNGSNPLALHPVPKITAGPSPHEVPRPKEARPAPQRDLNATGFHRCNPLFAYQAMLHQGQPPSHSPSGACSEYALHPEFHVEVCFNQKGCQGYVRIARTASCASAASLLATTQEVSDLIQLSGPDYFHVMLTGDEHIAPPLVYLGNCVYHFPFNITVTGKVIVKVLHIFEGHDAMKDSGGPYHLFPERWLVPHRLALECAAAPPQAPVPQCHGVVRDGRYVGPKWGLWQPYGCEYRRFSSSAAKQCLAGKRLAFIGDSQVRTTYDGLRNLLNGNLNAPIRKWTSTETKVHAIGGVTIDYMPDVWANSSMRPTRRGEGRVPSHLHQYDAVVFGTGQWQSRYNWTIEQTTQQVAWVMQQLQALRAASPRHPRIIWQGTPAIPLHMMEGMRRVDGLPKDGYVPQKLDKRVNQRYHLLNDLQLILAHCHQFHAVDAFAITHPHNNATPPIDFWGHYCSDADNPVLRALVDGVVAAACPS